MKIPATLRKMRRLAYHDFQHNKTDYPTVSEHCETGIQDINRMTELCLQVSDTLLFVDFVALLLMAPTTRNLVYLIEHGF